MWRFVCCNFFPFLLLSDPGSEVRDPGWKKIRIRDKHPRSEKFVVSGIRDPGWKNTGIRDPGLTSRVCKICWFYVASQGHHNNSCLFDFQLITRHTHVNYCLADEHECVGGVAEHLPKVYGSKNGLEWPESPGFHANNRVAGRSLAEVLPWTK